MLEPSPERWAELCADFKAEYEPMRVVPLGKEWWRHPQRVQGPQCDPLGCFGRGCHEHQGPSDRGRIVGTWVPPFPPEYFRFNRRDNITRVLTNLQWHCETCLLFDRPSNFSMCFDQIETCIGIGADDVGHKGGMCGA